VNLIRSEEEEIEDGREYVRIKEYLREMVCERRANKGRIINRFNREIRKLYTHESQKVSRIVGVESGALEVNAKSRTLYWWSQNHLDQEYVFKQAMVFVIAGTATFVYRTMPTCGN
jgi:cupin superfamily acireductone dioxygenase involved in methionine salvage